MTSLPSALSSALPSEQRLAFLCGPSAQNIAIRIVAETGSTNADLLADVPQLERPTLLWAQSQTAGKGRAGRVWHSSADATLTFSLAWKFAAPVQALIGLPLAVGVVIAETLASFGVEARLKWPNDVLKDGSKLAGILIETVVDKAGSNGRQSVWAIIGVGINIAGAEALSEQIGRAVADAPQLDLERERVMAALLNGLNHALPLFEKNGFRSFAGSWNALDAYAGKSVTIQNQGKILHGGIAAGVDETGCLLLDTGQGRIAVVAGDISLRMTEG